MDTFLLRDLAHAYDLRNRDIPADDWNPPTFCSKWDACAREPGHPDACHRHVRTPPPFDPRDKS